MGWGRTPSTEADAPVPPALSCSWCRQVRTCGQLPTFLQTHRSRPSTCASCLAASTCLWIQASARSVCRMLEAYCELYITTDVIHTGAPRRSQADHTKRGFPMWLLPDATDTEQRRTGDVRLSLHRDNTFHPSVAALSSVASVLTVRLGCCFEPAQMRGAVTKSSRWHVSCPHPHHRRGSHAPTLVTTILSSDMSAFTMAPMCALRRPPSRTTLSGQPNQQDRVADCHGHHCHVGSDAERECRAKEILLQRVSKSWISKVRKRWGEV